MSIRVNAGSIYALKKNNSLFVSKNIEYCIVISVQLETHEVSILEVIKKNKLIKENKNVILTYSSADINNCHIDDDIVINISHQSYLDFDNLDYECGVLKRNSFQQLMKMLVFNNTRTYYNNFHKNNFKDSFEPLRDNIKYAGRIYNEDEMINLVDSALDFWLTSGPYTARFEKMFSKKIGVKYCSVVNSGSSANLIAFMALTSSKLENSIKKDDEVITIAAGFPTTINPILQYGAVPVFVDIELPTYNIDVSYLVQARSERTKAVMIAHTLGNPFQINEVKLFCEKYDLWLIEDNCDALGSVYENRFTGTFGHIATSSFYPAHHITMGEGGATYTNSSRLKMIIDSFRDWGRDCYCAPGIDNTCNKRFKWKLGNLPEGYDHKYTYSHFGYNLKATEMQAAIGCAQIEKLDLFIEKRRINWKKLYDGLKSLEEYILLPKATEGSIPSWFGFVVTVKNTKYFSANKLMQYLESMNIQTRRLFAGNYINHPAFDSIRNDNKSYRVIGELNNTNTVLHNTFWIGVYPGMNDLMINYTIEKIHQFFKN